MKGIILAGGNGTRLRPLTYVTNKHLLPIYNKPMILYPLETLKMLGIKDILIVSGGEHIGWFTEFLGDGSVYNVNLTYRVQMEAGGIAEALGLARDFVGSDSATVILGDNIFDNYQISQIIPDVDLKEGRACIFLKKVPDPQRFGVPEFAGVEGEDWSTLRISRIVEKPATPPSEYAVTGLYHYPNIVFDVVKGLKPSDRGELEITDVNNYFVENGIMDFLRLDGYWSDAGTFDSLLASANWVKSTLTLDK